MKYRIIFIIIILGIAGTGYFLTKNIDKEELIAAVEVIEPIQEQTQQMIKEKQEIDTIVEEQKEVTEPIITNTNIITSFITHYSPNCYGCSGVTASGYDVKNTIYYNDIEYGQVRVVAMSRDYPLYSIIKIKDYKLGGDIIAIILDRGGAITGTKIDLLVETEDIAIQCGIQRNVQVEILRLGQ